MHNPDVEVNFALVADAANLTGGGKLNVLGAFTLINSTVFPAVHPDMTLVIGMTFAPADRGSTKQVIARFLTQDGTPLGEASVGIVVPDEAPPVHRVVQYAVIPVKQIVLPAPGSYEWSIELNGNQVTSVPIEARLLGVTSETDGNTD